jgi:hypothetical protein
MNRLPESRRRIEHRSFASADRLGLALCRGATLDSKAYQVKRAL